MRRSTAVPLSSHRCLTPARDTWCAVTYSTRCRSPKRAAPMAERTSGNAPVWQTPTAAAPPQPVRQPEAGDARAGEPVLEVRHLTVRYPIWGGVLRHKVGEV